MNKLLSICVVLMVQLCVLPGSGSYPNIIFLLTDDQSAYTLGCYGNEDVKTPHIDKLSAQGITFDNHYATTAICMASRANCMTGMYEYKTGCNFGYGDLLRSKWDKSYPNLLRAAGYMTAFVGKFGFLVAEEPSGRGILPEADFDRWGGGPGQTSYETSMNKSMLAYAEKYPHSTRSYGAFGADFIREAAESGKPFCLSISFKAAHRPVTPDPEYDDIYAGKTFKKPANYGRKHGEHFSKQSKQDRQYVRFEEWGYSNDYDNVMAKYHQQVYGVDVAVGMLRDALKENGVDDNTVIIYTSDNGFFCGSHGYGSKVLPYEESARVPLIIYDPRHKNSGNGLRSEALTGNIDFAPTILSLAGQPVPDEMDGVSLLPLYDNPRKDVRDTMLLMNVWGEAATRVLAVVSKEAKYINWSYAAEGFEVAEELYHLGKDPLELSNIAGNPENKQLLDKMRKHYDEAVVVWKKDADPHHGYARYAKIFDRSVPWSEKAPLYDMKAEKEEKKSKSKGEEAKKKKKPKA